MKDPSLGAFGVLALVWTLLAKVIIYERLCTHGATAWIVPAMAVSRHAMVSLITTLPYARPEGGMARPFVQGASPQRRAFSFAIALILGAAWGPLALMLVLTGEGAARLYARRMLRAFGGITGDLLGTANELMLLLFLLPVTLAPHTFSSMKGWAWILGPG